MKVEDEGGVDLLLSMVPSEEPACASYRKVLAALFQPATYLSNFVFRRYRVGDYRELGGRGIVGLIASLSR